MSSDYREYCNTKVFTHKHTLKPAFQTLFAYSCFKSEFKDPIGVKPRQIKSCTYCFLHRLQGCLRRPGFANTDGRVINDDMTERIMAFVRSSDRPSWRTTSEDLSSDIWGRTLCQIVDLEDVAVAQRAIADLRLYRHHWTALLSSLVSRPSRQQAETILRIDAG